MNASNRLVVSVLAVAALAIAFWMLALGPKHDEASKLSGQVDQLQTALSEARSKAAEATAARRHFPADYRQLIVLGQAVPGGDDTASLMVELNTIGAKEGIRFNQFELESSGETAEAAPAPAPAPIAPPAGESASAVPASSTVPPTEAAASLLPLGASVGTAGLGVMPYHLTFTGNFFQITDFIRGIDSLVDTGSSSVGVNGRLVTINGFALNLEEEEEEGKKVSSDELNATFAVNTYVTPPTQSLTAGATPTAPAPITTPVGAGAAATQASSTAEPSAAASSETVAAR
jgi:Tfp pilus assembly protein PilO